jgi:hypothetical protein
LQNSETVDEKIYTFKISYDPGRDTIYAALKSEEST